MPKGGEWVFSLFGNVTDDNITFCAKTKYKITKFVQNEHKCDLCKLGQWENH